MIGQVFTMNRRHFGKNIWPEGYVYCGRAMGKSGYKGVEKKSIFANRHWSPSEIDRHANVVAFREDLKKDWVENGPMRQEIDRLATEVAGGDSIVLVCWCKPKECHTDVIKEAIENRARKFEEMASVVTDGEE